MPIPRRIVQTHRAPDIGLRCRHTWQHRNPGFAYFFLDDRQCKDFLDEYHPRLVSMYERLPLPVQRADVFRYAYLYSNGGIYADVDTICLSGLEDYIDFSSDHLVAGIEMSPAEFRLPQSMYEQMYCRPMQLLQWTFAASPGHPALKLLLDRIESQVMSLSDQELHQRSRVDRETLSMTGPVAFTHAVLKYMEEGGGPPVTVLPRSAWGCWPQEPPHPSQPPRVRHLFEGGWKRQPAARRR